MELSVTATKKKDNHEPLAQAIWHEVVGDFAPSRGGDHKILRAVGRTAIVNAAVTVTAATGGAAGIVGYLTGGAITAKRIGDGIDKDDPKEVVKGLTVYGSATSASMAGQAITGALLVGVAGASLPVAGAVAFGVGCCSGIAAGALSEWGVDNAWEDTQATENEESEARECDQEEVALEFRDRAEASEKSQSDFVEKTIKLKRNSIFSVFIDSFDNKAIGPMKNREKTRFMESEFLKRPIQSKRNSLFSRFHDDFDDDAVVGSLNEDLRNFLSQ